jgi:hypothetical protein
MSAKRSRRVHQFVGNELEHREAIARRAKHRVKAEIKTANSFTVFRLNDLSSAKGWAVRSKSYHTDQLIFLSKFLFSKFSLFILTYAMTV